MWWLEVVGVAVGAEPSRPQPGLGWMRTIFGVFISEWQFSYFKIQVDKYLAKLPNWEEERCGLSWVLRA